MRLPVRIMLEIDGKVDGKVDGKPVRACEVVRQHGCEIGVRFVD